MPTPVIIQGARAQQAGDNFIHGQGFTWSDNSGDDAYIAQGVDQYKTSTQRPPLITNGGL